MHGPRSRLGRGGDLGVEEHEGHGIGGLGDDGVHAAQRTLRLLHAPPCQFARVTRQFERGWGCADAHEAHSWHRVGEDGGDVARVSSHGGEDTLARVSGCILTRVRGYPQTGVKIHAVWG
eukprot:2743736-Rhodomonas_salina.1